MTAKQSLKEIRLTPRFPEPCAQVRFLPSAHPKIDKKLPEIKELSTIGSETSTSFTGVSAGPFAVAPEPVTNRVQMVA
jgi:hypothetical protein